MAWVRLGVRQDHAGPGVLEALPRQTLVHTSLLVRMAFPSTHTREPRGRAQGAAVGRAFPPVDRRFLVLRTARTLRWEAVLVEVLALRLVRQEACLVVGILGTAAAAGYRRGRRPRGDLLPAEALEARPEGEVQVEAVARRRGVRRAQVVGRRQEVRRAEVALEVGLRPVRQVRGARQEATQVVEEAAAALRLPLRRREVAVARSSRSLVREEIQVRS